MNISHLILIAAFGVHANAETDGKEHHKQVFATHSGGPRSLRLLEEHVPTESRIVGGADADVGEYPFFVEWAGCGASLIHPGKFPMSCL